MASINAVKNLIPPPFFREAQPSYAIRRGTATVSNSRTKREHGQGAKGILAQSVVANALVVGARIAGNAGAHTATANALRARAQDVAAIRALAKNSAIAAGATSDGARTRPFGPHVGPRAIESADFVHAVGGRRTGGGRTGERPACVLIAIDIGIMTAISIIVAIGVATGVGVAVRVAPVVLGLEIIPIPVARPGNTENEHDEGNDG